MDKKIAIVGGGIVGSTAAYYLSKAGHQVHLFDEGLGQASRAAAGIICPWFSLRRNKAWYFLVSQGAEFYSKLMTDLARDGIQSKNIYQQSGAILIRRQEKRIQTDLAQAAIKRQASPMIGQVAALSSAQIEAQIPWLRTSYGGIWVEGGARVHGDQLVQALQSQSQKYGCQIHRQKVQLQRDSSLARKVRIVGQDQAYDAILLSPGAWLKELLQPIGYQVDLQAQKGQLFSLYDPAWQHHNWPVIMPFGQVDLIPFADGTIVFGATHEDQAGFDLSVDTASLATLRQEGLNWAPDLADYPFHQIKVGTRAHTSDYSVLLGQVPDLHNVWAISGLGSSGLTSGPYLAYQWAQLIQTGTWAIDSQAFPIDKYIQKN